MAKIRDGSTYLSEHLAANDYYCENEAVVGAWIGRGAEKLGLREPIHSGDIAFENLRRNRLPDGTGKLTPRDGPDRVRFYDFQCSAQKSVSIMAVTLGDTRLASAHDRATAVAFAELEKFAATQANTQLTRANRFTGNLIAAAFRHTASRALDPQVHTHFVVANATWDEPTKSWRALTEFEMVRAIRYAGKVYQNELARLCREMGYRIVPARDERGVVGFEIEGVSDAIRGRFSKRRAEVERGIADFVQKYGRQPTKAEIHAITVASREAKLREITTPAVLADQRRQLSGEEWAQLAALKDRAIAGAESITAAPTRERESLERAIGHLFERRSVVLGHELMAEALNQNLGYMELSKLRSDAAKAGLVRLTDDPPLRASFATPNGLSLERWSIRFIEETKGTFAELGAGTDLERLSEAQREAVRDVLSSRDQVVCLRGVAGAGKTTVLASMNPTLSAGGRTVYYCAPTSSAADTLRKEGMNATTVSDFLTNVAVRECNRLRDAVIVVDESGLASNRQGAAILRLSERHHARVVFVGDSRQHTAIEAGDFVRVLERHSPMHRVELAEIRRQQDRDYRNAIQLMANGATQWGFESLNERGWVHEGGPEYLKAAASEYVKVAARDGTDRVIAVTPTWEENRVFSTAVREQLKGQGALGPGETVVAYEPLSWTAEQKRHSENYLPGLVVTFNARTGAFRAGQSAIVNRVEAGQVWIKGPGVGGERRLPVRRGWFEVSRMAAMEICVGEKLLIRANHRSLGLLNGDTMTVRGIHGGIIDMADGRRIDSQAVRELTYGYAVTSHKSQSKTADHVIVAAARLDAKSAYVACSRGRDRCSVHTPDKEFLFDHLPSGERAAAIEVLDSTMANSRVAPLRPEDSEVCASRRWPEQVKQAMGVGWWQDRFFELKQPNRGASEIARANEK